MLWLALHFPDLPLAALHLAPDDHACVVVEQQRRKELVVALNPAAAAAGIRPGQRRAAAQALAASLGIARRRPEQETALLGNLASWAMQFSPTVSLDPPLGLLLEIEGCLSYFKGLPRLRQLASDGLATLSISAHQAVAPTPLAASWLAQLGMADAVLDQAALQTQLDQLAVRQLPFDSATQQKLQAMGLKHLADLRDLPHASLAQRFGRDFPQSLDRAYGRQPDPRPLFVPPERFARSIELNWATDQVEALAFVAKRLLIELAAFMWSRCLGVQQVIFRWQHDDRSSSNLTVSFGKPTRDADAMLSITREALARCTLPARVEAITLLAEQLHTLQGEKRDLFGNNASDSDFALLAARLEARLGAGSVRSLACKADHRPELAWQLGDDNASSTANERPGWLLAEPRKLDLRQQRPWYGEPLSLHSGMERIESGWWDGAGIGRDYFQASGPSGQRYWLFRQRDDGEWYLQGMFA